MRRFLALLILALALAPACMADFNGSWTAVPKDDGRVQLSLAHDTSSHSSSSFTLSDFTGLTDAQVHAATQTPVQFEMRREAGTVSFEGTFKKNFGAGQFTFTPSRSYYAAVRALGIDTRELERDDDGEEKVFALAIHDVSTAYIKSMIAEGYRVDLDKYLAFRIFRVTPQLVAEFHELGFRNISADDILAAQVHKVTPRYVREMRAAGFTDLTLDQLMASRIHKVTPAFVEKMRSLGFEGADFDDLVAFRIHGVTPELVGEVHALGYPNVTSDQLVAMRIHRVTPEFIREMEAAGYSRVPIDKLVAMKIHGIDAQYVKKMNGLK